MVVQDDDYLYLIMEYLPGGDVMVRAEPLPYDNQQIPALVTYMR